MKKLLIFGAGQYGNVAREIAQAMSCFSQIDFLDDHAPIAIGQILDYKRHLADYDCAIVAIGNPQVRMQYIEELSPQIEIATLISPLAYISCSATVAKGCIVEPMAVIHANTYVGKGCILSAGSVVNHNAVLEDGCHVDCNATVAARALVPAQTKIQSCTFFQNI